VHDPPVTVARLQRPRHLLGRPEEAVGRHQGVEALVRPLEVVVIDVMAQPPPGVGQVHEHRRLQALTPQRPPEALDLAQGLRVPRRRHHLADAALGQLAAQGAGAPPGHVLRAVVGQDLLGRAEGIQRRPQHFQDQGRGLRRVQAEAGNEATVVVQEGDQRDAAILLLQDEREQVGLPQLIGRGPLEARDRWGVWRVRGHVLQHVAGLAEDAGHGGGAGGQGQAAQQQVADLLAAPVGVRLLHQQDGALGQLRQFAARGGAALLVDQAGGPELVEALLPGVEGVPGEADERGEVAGGQAGTDPGVENEEPLRGRERRRRGDRG
jgi:hypothetical protein